VTPKVPGRKFLKTLLLLAVLAAAAALLRLTLFRPEVVDVTVYHVQSGTVEDTVVNSRAGTVQSRLRAKMSPAIPGLVTEIVAKKGTRVNAGDVLLRLDDSEHRAQVQLAERSLEGAQAGAEQARVEAEHAQWLWQRSQQLAKNDVVSATTLEQDQTRAKATDAVLGAARARIREAEASLAVAQATLEKTVMKAPFNGVVLDVTTEVGEWISPAPPGVFIPPVVDVIDPNALYISAPIDEADVSRLRVGLPVRITLDAFHGTSLSGKLSYVSSFVETREDQNRTLRVEAEFAGTDLPPNLLPGLSADLEIILDRRDTVLRIPSYALMEGNRVLTIANDVLEERKVATGLRNWSYTEIVSGLSAGEPVVVSLDRPEVKSGARVGTAKEVEQ
jgi:HlyD family secretion protein